MGKTISLKGAAIFSKTKKSDGQSVGLIVGSFDILHMGHINLFRFAKKHTDNVIVGLDNDQTIKLVKGANRPVNNFKLRSKLLSDLSTVDKIFLIEKTSHHDSEQAVENYETIIDIIKPTHIFTHIICDRHWKNKKQLAKERGVCFLPDKSKKITNSGTILNKLLTEY